jgi:hypothetical protein
MNGHEIYLKSPHAHSLLFIYLRISVASKTSTTVP